MKRAVVALSLALAVAAVSCREQQSLTSPRRLSGDFSDGRTTGGNPHFFFLPPIIGQPSFSGTFNPNLAPVVEICQLNVDASNTPLDCNATAPLINPGPVQLDVVNQQYEVDWHTDLPAIDPTKFYRIQAFGSPGSARLGFADIAPVANGGQFKNVNTGQYIGLVDGRTLPIKFRIELGAYTSNNACTDCAEQVVTNNGATVTTNTGFAGASFPAGWLRPAFVSTFGDQVLVTIERVPISNDADVNLLNRCLPISRQQFEGCYRFTTTPFAGPFAKLVTVGLCVTLGETDPRHDGVVLFSVEEPVTSESGVTRLPNAPAPFVTCTGFPPTGGGLGARFRRWTNTALGRLAPWLVPFAPSPLHAAHLGVGGLDGSFSRIGWVLPGAAAITFDVDPNGAPVAPGTVVNTLYSPVDVAFTRIPASGSLFCGVSTNVYANDNGPLPGGGFGFGSGNNVVTVCPEGTASDFSENQGGRIQAQFTLLATQVCVNVWPTGFQGGPATGATGFLEAFDATGTSLAKVTSLLTVPDRICVVASGIDHVQFAGTGDAFAIFDNLDVVF